MAVPEWRTSRAGARIRVALWLSAEVGPGGTFTKAQLREAFPKIEQIDRRMRDLRPDGWVIATYREDRTLASDELRLVMIGAPVWDKGYRSPATDTIGDKARRTVLAAHNYTCAYCGIGPGEKYADDPLRTARLSISRLGSGAARSLVPLCDRCLAGGGADAPRVDQIIDAIQSLSGGERTKLDGWISHGERTQSPAEVVWATWRRLPREVRQEIVRKAGGR